MALPIQTQPGQGGQWMQSPQGMTGIPPGLEYMSALDQIIVKTGPSGCCIRNIYEVLNSVGQQCYYAEEESEYCDRILCSKEREYVMHITDNTQREVMRIRHDFIYCVGCCWCATDSTCGYEVQIEAPIGNIIGYAKQQTSEWNPHIRVFNAYRQPMYVVRGPCLWSFQNCFFSDDIDFPITDLTEQNVLGRMFKRWAGFERERCTGANTFGVTFPADMDITSKALLFGTLFLVDVLYYENQRKNK